MPQYPTTHSHYHNTTLLVKYISNRKSDRTKFIQCIPWFCKGLDKFVNHFLKKLKGPILDAKHSLRRKKLQGKTTGTFFRRLYFLLSGTGKCNTYFKIKEWLSGCMFMTWGSLDQPTASSLTPLSNLAETKNTYSSSPMLGIAYIFNLWSTLHWYFCMAVYQHYTATELIVWELLCVIYLILGDSHMKSNGPPVCQFCYYQLIRQETKPDELVLHYCKAILTETCKFSLPHLYSPRK